MGNLISCLKKKKHESLLEKQCPYCKFEFASGKEKRKHIKNCVYNTGDERELSFYTDPYKL